MQYALGSHTLTVRARIRVEHCVWLERPLLALEHAETHGSLEQLHERATRMRLRASGFTRIERIHFKILNNLKYWTCCSTTPRAIPPNFPFARCTSLTSLHAALRRLLKWYWRRKIIRLDKPLNHPVR